MYVRTCLLSLSKWYTALVIFHLLPCYRKPAVPSLISSTRLMMFTAMLEEKKQIITCQEHCWKSNLL